MDIDSGGTCDCILCVELTGNPDSDFHRRTQNAIASRVLVEMHGFVVLPDVAPIVPGHLLIATVAHAVSMSTLDIQGLRRLTHLMNRVRDTFLTHYERPTVFFEHGPFDEFDRAGCCVYHAHMHALPAAVDVTASLAKLYDAVPLERVEELQRYSREGLPYLFFERGDGQRFGYAPVRAVSQIIRRLICMELRLPTRSRWEDAVDIPMIRETLVTLRPAFRDASAR